MACAHLLQQHNGGGCHATHCEPWPLSAQVIDRLQWLRVLLLGETGSAAWQWLVESRRLAARMGEPARQRSVFSSSAAP
jgi:hypothetical protein